MGWFAGESSSSRGLSWRDQTLRSISPPPLPLMFFLGSVLFWMYMGSHSDNKKAKSSNSNSSFILRFLVPLFVIFLLHVFMVSNRWFSPAPTGYYSTPFYQSMSDDNSISSPLRVALLLLLLLVMINYQGSVQSGWFRLLWSYIDHCCYSLYSTQIK